MSSGRVIVYGGHGALGAAVVKYFKSNSWWVGSVDLVDNDEADASVAIPKDYSWTAQGEVVMSGLEEALGSNKVDAIINVAGGWAGGNAASKDFLKNSELVWQQSVWSSTIAAHAASRFLKDGGMISLTGAIPAVDATPGMMGYGLAKGAVHQLTKSLAAEKSGLPPGAFAVAILPLTLDTEINRKWMPKADVSTWTSLEFVAEVLFKWTQGDERPPSGSLVKLVTKDSKTELVLV